MENWKLIPGLPNYEVSDMGRVRRATAAQRTRIGNIIDRKPLPNGYKQALLSIAPSKYKQFLVHRLVMLSFVGPSALQVNHKNGVRDDNRLSNLEYMTAKQNQLHAAESFGSGRGVKNGRAKLKESDIIAIRTSRASGLSCRKIAAQYKVAKSLIERICSKEAWGHIP